MVLKLHSSKQWVNCHVKDTVLEHDPGGIIVKLHCTEYFIHLIHLIKSSGGFCCIHPFPAVNCRSNSQPKPGWLGCIVVRVTFLVHQDKEEKLKILFFRASADVAVRQPEHPVPVAAIIWGSTSHLLPQSWELSYERLALQPWSYQPSLSKRAPQINQCAYSTWCPWTAGVWFNTC